MRAHACVFTVMDAYYEYHMDPAHNYSLFPQQGLFPRPYLTENDYFAINIPNVISTYLLIVYLVTILVAHVL
jgi:predicted ABC-type exoprotein transport system permease subunit